MSFERGEKVLRCDAVAWTITLAPEDPLSERITNQLHRRRLGGTCRMTRRGREGCIVPARCHRDRLDCKESEVSVPVMDTLKLLGDGSPKASRHPRPKRTDSTDLCAH